MAGSVSYGQLRTAIEDISAAVQTNLALLEGLDPAAIIGVSRPVPPGKPDWRCLLGLPSTSGLVIDKGSPPTLDWRCLAGFEMTIGDLSAYLQAVADHCEIVESMLEAADQGGFVPTI